MPDTEKRMEPMLFDYGTTYRTDYRDGEITVPTLTTYKAKPGCVRIRPPPLKDVHTLSAWKTVCVPFSLTHMRKAIVRTDPTKVQQPFVRPPDAEKKHSIKTRPRLVMTPAVSMDDVADPRARQILCDSMYTSDMTRATREAVSDYFSIKLPRLNMPYVSPEWRMDTVSWDNKQLRAYCDTTKDFWLEQELPPCNACRTSEKVEADRKMRFQMQAGKQ